MKLNPKVFKSLKNEPFEVQFIGDTKVAFYDMNDTMYLTQYAGRGKFAIWTSDGSNEYRVLIEKSYYEALKPFYELEINTIWLGFLIKAGEISKKINYFFMIPTIALYLIVATLSALYLPNYMIQVLLGLLAIVFISNMFQTRITSKRVKEENIKAQEDIRTTIGLEEFDELVKAQETHYQNYFNFDDKQPEQPQEEIVEEENIEDKEK
ncbi:MAG: hypothetical protein AB7E61_02360 [Acholeplasmataceae bacterium]